MPFPAFPPNLPLSRPGLSSTDRVIEEKFLDAVQGNILKGHGRDHQRLVFFSFGPKPADARKMVRAAATLDKEIRQRPWVRSAREQRDQRNLWHTAWFVQERMKDPQWVMPEHLSESYIKHLIDTSGVQYYSGLLLSRSGLIALGVTPSEIKTLDPLFDRGMADGMRGTLMRPHVNPNDWTEPYTQDFHGAFLLACNEEKFLDEKLVPALRDWCHGHGATVWMGQDQIQPGSTWRDDGNPYGTGYKPPREPFGFVDGISMPRFFYEDQEPVTTAGAPAAWKSIDLQLADAFVTRGAHAGGSFVALLKLEQDVQKFRDHETKIASLLGASGFPGAAAAELAPALMMGRNRLGHTLAQTLRTLPIPIPGPQSPTRPPTMPSWLNEFNFKDSRQSAGCPFHAHIRKANPRADAPGVGDEEAVSKAQPIRRGMIFDPKGKLAAREAAGLGPWPTLGDNVGLLFLAYMASPSRQFEQWHNTWAVDPEFPVEGTDNTDPILFGHAKAWNFQGLALPPLPPVVKRLGGAYFFAPSIHWLENL